MGIFLFKRIFRKKLPSIASKILDEQKHGLIRKECVVTKAEYDELWDWMRVHANQHISKDAVLTDTLEKKIEGTVLGTLIKFNN